MTGNDRPERVLTGTGVTPLSGVGSVLRYEPGAGVDPGDDRQAGSPDEEKDRFRSARDSVRADLRAERERTAERVGEEEARIFDAHIQFLDDPGVEADVEDAIARGLSAARAVDRAFAEAIDRLEAAGGKMAERTDDLREVRDRLLRELLGEAPTDLADLPAGAVVVAERLGPADTAQLDPDRVAGFATATGGRTSHAAILARSLGIPAVVGVGDGFETLSDGATALVDGEAGELVVNPPESRRRDAESGRDVAVRHGPVETADGRAIEVAANVGTPREARTARDRGADGVGLFRTEFFFLDRDEPPSEREQYEAFVDVLGTFPGDRVVVRTLDVGGDKPVPYLDVEPGANPFLGVRGLRLSPGERADLFETQLRALLRAAATDDGDGLAVMFPLVTSVPELTDAIERVERVADALDDEGVPHRMPELGVMIETPASVLLAAELAARVDFLSIGTNDLGQYVMATARDDDRLAELSNPLQPPVLRAIDRTVRAGHGADAWVGMCGEMAGDPALSELLVGLGLDELSLSAVTIPEVKAAVAEVDAGAARTLAERALAAETRAGVESALENWSG